MAAISGAIGLKPTLAAIERGATVALANKECLVCAGSAVHAPRGEHGRHRAAGRLASTTRSSRRSAPGRREDVKRIILTASGGPFRTWSLDRDQEGDARTGAAPSELVDGAARSPSIPRP